MSLTPYTIQSFPAPDVKQTELPTTPFDNSIVVYTQE